MAWAEKRDSGRWQGVYRTPDGKRRSAGTHPHKAKALRAAAAAEDETRAAGWRDPRAGQITLGAWIEQWWPTRPVAASTLSADAYRRDGHLLPRWADVPLIEITRHDVRAWASALSASGLSPASVHRCVALLSAALTAAVDAELIPAHPALRLRLPQGIPATERYLTRDEYAGAREWLEPRDQLVADLLVTTGMRWSEAAGLHAHRVTGEWIRVVESLDNRHRVVRPIPKGKQVRDVPLVEHVAERVQAAIAASDARKCNVKHEAGRCRSGLVLTTAAGYALEHSRWTTKWRTACRYAGIEPCGTHALRHTYASWLAQDGVSMVEIGRMLGHSSPLVTQRYAHLAPPDHGHVTTAADWLAGGKTGGKDAGHAVT